MLKGNDHFVVVLLAVIVQVLMLLLALTERNKSINIINNQNAALVVQTQRIEEK